MVVDSFHARDSASCKLISGFLICVESASVQWFSMNQFTEEISVIVSEFVTMKQGINALRGLRYNLRMMGIPISGLSNIYGAHM